MLALIFFFHPFVLANSTFPRTLAIQFWKSWGLKDGDIKGLQSGTFPLEEYICVEIGIDETQLVCGEMALGSRLERGLFSYVTYLLVLVSYLCTMKRKHFFWAQNTSAEVFLVHLRCPGNVLRMGYRCSVLLKMNSPFCADAKCKDIPELSQHQDCSMACWLTCAKKSFDFCL